MYRSAIPDWVRRRADDLLSSAGISDTTKSGGILSKNGSAQRSIDPECVSDTGNPYACTDINPQTGRIETTYTPYYFELDPVSRQSVDIHEAAHVPQIQEYLHWWRPDSWSRERVNHDATADPAKFEVPAYTAQDDFLTRHVTDSNNRYDPRVWDMWYGNRVQLDKYRRMKR